MKKQIKKQGPSFGDSFLEDYAGSSILAKPQIAIIELIANSWDAGATEVFISWPVNDHENFSIIDNGHGMAENEFNSRFRQLSYNRNREQSNFADVPSDLKDKVGLRPTFGKNGKGRLGGFAFGEIFFVRTWTKGKESTFQVAKDFKNILSFSIVSSKDGIPGHGTEISVPNAIGTNIPENDIKKEIGMRFLTDPHFIVKVNNHTVSFEDIPKDHICKMTLNFDEIGNVTITAINTSETDKTTQFHGIAWHVQRRLVGECTWRGSGSESFVDGRRSVAKRFIFIVEADLLKDSVLFDWTGFNPKCERWQKVAEKVYTEIKKYLSSLTVNQREGTFKEIEKATKNELKKMGIVSREKWEDFVKQIQEECPTICFDDLGKIANVLAKLENSTSKFSLIDQLSNLSVEELDHLNEILEKWDIDYAKIVLDEIEYRVTLLEKLQFKVFSADTDEVQELQPLFHRGLWIFGPEYEAIEFTSNQGMTKLIQDVFGKDQLTGSRNRPDFAILPDGSVGLYSLPTYDDNGGEVGIDRLTIVELKKPIVPIGSEQKDQAWKYVKELYDKGALSPASKVTCFVLGKSIEPLETGIRTERNDSVRIIPLNYDTVIRRAHSRLLNLAKKIQNAKFLENVKIRQMLKDKNQREMTF